mgnify:CR=1 FL=1
MGDARLLLAFDGERGDFGVPGAERELEGLPGLYVDINFFLSAEWMMSCVDVNSRGERRTRAGVPPGLR